MEQLISVILGVSLASAVGFRIFIPFLVVSIAAHFGYFDLNENWEWIGGISSIITFAVATVVEVFAYFIPFVDNLLDTIAIPIAGIAGSAIMLSTIGEFDPLITYSLAILAGGGTAALVKSATSTSRLASSTVTAGLANPVVSATESGISSALSLSAVFVPLIAFILVVLVLFLMFKLYSKTKRVIR
ncbi:DUF4126 domain-containing protein [Namhaeicola litoreus]|uniref:DUF4126 domain-containing protein n=1 Tax=Namhaeicola litoreus TaxID=1052145 RepID=A0ABW3Y393_9FLAO